MFSRVYWQFPAMFSADNLNLHWRWRDWIQATLWNIFYFTSYSSNVADDQSDPKLNLNHQSWKFSNCNWIKLLCALDQNNNKFFALMNHRYFLLCPWLSVRALYLLLLSHIAQHSVTFLAFKKVWSIEIECITFSCKA